MEQETVCWSVWTSFWEYAETGYKTPYASAYLDIPKATSRTISRTKNARKRTIIGIRTETEHHSLTENDERGWKHSGECRKVTAWLGRSEIDRATTERTGGAKR